MWKRKTNKTIKIRVNQEILIDKWYMVGEHEIKPEILNKINKRFIGKIIEII